MSSFGESTSYDVECDVAQGFNFDKSNTSVFGFVEKLKIGDLEVPADFNLKNPDEESAKEVAGVIRHFYWDGKKQSPLELMVQVGGTAQQKLDLLIHKEMKKEDVSIQFKIYKFDSGAGQAFYPKFHTLDAEIKGVVRKEKVGDDTKRCISIEERKSGEVAEPENFILTLHIDPQSAQELGAAASTSDKFVVDWGTD